STNNFFMSRLSLSRAPPIGG
ncbi:hypothetical protein ACTHJB_24780, partial (plasmid) [Salmonella enterica subsp. enterica serovar Typhimurium]|nr:hypothetical protein [Salmonella enterica]